MTYQKQIGNIMIQWIVLTMTLTILLFAKLQNDNSAAQLLEKEIKEAYKRETFSGRLP